MWLQTERNSDGEVLHLTVIFFRVKKKVTAILTLFYLLFYFLHSNGPCYLTCFNIIYLLLNFLNYVLTICCLSFWGGVPTWYIWIPPKISYPCTCSGQRYQHAVNGINMNPYVLREGGVGLPSRQALSGSLVEYEPKQSVSKG